MRNKVMVWVVLFFFLLFSDLTYSSTMGHFSKNFPAYIDAAFAWPQQINPGTPLNIMVSESKDNIQIQLQILNENNGWDSVQNVANLRSSNKPEDCTVEKGCPWKPTWKVTNTKTLEPGIYRGIVKSGTRVFQPFYFTVTDFDRKTEVLYLQDINTAYAYNFYGGGSVYGHFDESTGKILRNSVQSDTYLFSTQRPITAFNNVFSLPTPKEVFPGKVFYSIGKTVFPKIQPILNSHFSEVTKKHFPNLKLLIVAGLNEYPTPEFLNSLESYLRSGGLIIMSSNEFAFRSIRMNSDKSQFFYYYNPKKDPSFESKENPIAGFSGAFHGIDERFGVAVERGIGIDWDHSEPFGLEFLIRNHPLIAGIDLGKLSPIRQWALGADLKKGKDGFYLFKDNKFNVSGSEILAVSKVLVPENYDDIQCCRRQIQWDREYNGEIKYTKKSSGKYRYAIFAKIRVGKGTLILFPEDLFGGQFDTIKKFLNNVKVHMIK